MAATAHRFTRKQLAQRVEFWRRRICPDFDVQLLREPPEPEHWQDNWGHIEPDPTYRRGKLWVNTRTIPDAKQLDETICHELVHLALADLAKVQEDIALDLGNEARTALRRRWDEAAEHAAEQLARVIAGMPADTRWNRNGH